MGSEDWGANDHILGSLFLDAVKAYLTNEKPLKTPEFFGSLFIFCLSEAWLSFDSLLFV